MFEDDATPRQLVERTGRHYCIRCLAEVASEEYLRNDHLCDACSGEEMAADDEKK